MSSRKKKPTARKAARKPVRKATRKSAPKSASKSASKPKPMPKAKSKSKSKVKVKVKAARKPARKAAPTPAPKPAPKPVPKAAPKRARTVSPQAAGVAAPPAAPQDTAPEAPAPATEPETPPAVATVQVGHAVADFTAPVTGGGTWRSIDARGRKLVLYFYPRDNTPGCTLEGQQFAALAPQFAAAGVTVLGVSRDSIASHEKFREKMRFPFDLLSDVEEALCRQFDVIREKNMYGRKVMGVERSTFLIDAEGVLRREWRAVKVEGHAQEVLTAAQAL